jgi:chitodextrinase
VEFCFSKARIAGRRSVPRLAFLLVLVAGLLSFGTREPAVASPAGASVAAASDPVIATAGDIACDPTNSNFKGGLGSSSSCRMKYTSDLLVNAGLSGVLILGDNQYYCGGYQAFVQSYDLSWGRIKNITYPSVGNHEYLTSGGTDCNSANTGAAGYYRYFGAAAGDPAKGYYSFDIGTWHLIALNTQCTPAGGCGATSAQGKWLRADLAAHSNFCTLAYWHIPLFSSGGRANNNSRSFWDALYAANADLVLTSHDHLYERFGPQRPDGTADAVRGLRSFVVGTGGANHTSFTSTIFANSEVRNDKTFGVLKLTLHPTSYDWQFVPEAGATFADSGNTACHGDQSDTTPPSAPGNLGASASAPNEIDLSWTASSDNVGVVGYRISRDGAQIATVTGTSYADRGVQPNTTHSYTVVAYDGGGNVSANSNTASATTPRDTQAPSAPANLSASAPSASRVDLSWTASTDNVGVARYQIFRNGVPLGTSTTNSYSDTTVSAQSTYSYIVTAQDSSNNSSPPSNTAVVTTPAAATTLTFSANADTYVQADQPTTNYGSSNQIVADASPVRHTLLKFVVTGVAGRRVASAKLFLQCVDPSGKGGNFHRVADSSWGEGTVNWNTQPAADTAVIDSLGSVSAGTSYQVDLTSLITADGTYTVEADSTSSDGAYYSSKEGSVPPQLVVTVS